jgi:phosphoribosylamine-glycine ligase
MKKRLRVMAWGVGAFTQGMLRILKEDGAEVCTYLTRDYAHDPPAMEGEVFLREMYPNPCPILREKKIDFVVPMSIDWILEDWVEEFLDMGIPIFSPYGEGMRLERERDFARKLCRRFHIPFPRAFVARNRLEAEQILQKHPRPYVIKNPLCSPTSPIHTIVCETLEETRSWLDHIDYAEGVFFQEYMGRREAGHIALVSGGELYSLVTNQEYKRAFDGNMGIVAGAPLGGLVEQDPDDKYGLAEALLKPLLPWFREVGFHGPVQVTAARRDGKWYVLEYNVRLGVTSGPMILRMLENPLDVLWDTVRNRPLNIRFKKDFKFGCSLTLAGYGYPYTRITGPEVPITVDGQFDCDVWWNEVRIKGNGQLVATGHRIADVVALAPTLEKAIETAYRNIRKIHCLASYYRLDIGKSLWPPGKE